MLHLINHDKPYSNPKLEISISRVRLRIASTLFCCPRFTQTAFHEMDLEGWRIQAMRAWEAAGVFAEEFRLQKQKEFRYRKPDGNGEAVLQSVTNGLTHCKDIARKMGSQRGKYQSSLPG